jgi:HTH-type transcriptional regulator/antitoxin HigA
MPKRWSRADVFDPLEWQAAWWPAEVSEDEDHPLSSFLDLVSDLVSLYEREHFPVPPADSVEALRFLMAAWGLKQEYLAGLVAQSNLSAILAGKRKISAGLAGKLGRFFGVSPALFILGT